MAKHKVMLVHVYAGTQGTAGLYLNETIKAIQETNITQKAFVSYYYPFNNAKKIFYKYTDLASGRKKTKIRPYVRYLELLYALIYIFCNIIYIHPQYLNYSLNSSYLIEYYFLILIRKILKTRIILTCHDIIPFDNNYLDISKENKRRSYLFKMADLLLVHNENSKRDLIEYYRVTSDKIIYHSFPFMDLSLWNFEVLNKNIDFLFIGHLRKEKGIDVLLDAWRKFNKKVPSANLYIVGNMPTNSTLNVSEYKNQNIKFILNYVNDSNYTKLIASSRCVVLPYLRGTNSGIPSSALSMRSYLIVSDIPMFQNNKIIEKDAFFESGNSDSLLEKLLLFNNKNSINDVSELIRNYKRTFVCEVTNLYNSILKEQENIDL